MRYRVWQTQIGNYGSFFAFYHPLPPHSSTKDEKNCWGYRHFTQVYPKPKLHEVRLLRYGLRQTEFLSFWATFCPFTPLLTRKVKFGNNVKNAWRYHPFKHVNHKWRSYDVCGSWDVERDRIICHFGLFFCHFTPLTTWKIKILKKWKMHLEISSFYTRVIQITIIWRMVPQICSAVDRSYYHFGLFFALLPSKNPKKQNFEKMKKKQTPGDIISLHKCTKIIIIC